MIIEVDSESGFCPGVVSAIHKAEVELQTRQELYCLGDIVHNSQEVSRLQEQGLITIDHEQLASLENTKVLLRAHGEPPSTYEVALRNNITIVDATCPVVLQLQKKILRMYNSEPDAQIVIFGKQGHAEVNGLVGQTQGSAIVIESEADLCKVDFSRPVRLFSQTTMSVDHFRELTSLMSEKMQPGVDFKSFDTICRQVANRIPHIRQFASSHDIVLFVSGKKSSNGKALFEVCHSQNPRSWFISSPDDVLVSMFDGVTSIGICGATSTPKWQMEQVAEKVRSLVGSCV